MTAVAIAFGGGIVLASMLGGKSSRRSRSVTSSYSHTPTPSPTTKLTRLLKPGTR